MFKDLTENIYKYILERAEEDEIPSVREICKHFDLKSTSTAQRHLNILVEQGLIQKIEGQKRNIKLPRQKTKNIPLLGVVTAGLPITAIQNIQEYIPFSGYSGSGENLFALKVRGDSMIGAGILNDDIVVCEKTPVADNGTIVVAMIDDEATVKRFFKEKDCCRLQPENDDYLPIISKDVKILGRVISLIRYY